jgi:hypothetical protein
LVSVLVGTTALVVKVTVLLNGWPPLEVSYFTPITLLHLEQLALLGK